MVVFVVVVVVVGGAVVTAIGVVGDVVNVATIFVVGGVRVIDAAFAVVVDVTLIWMKVSMFFSSYLQKESSTAQTTKRKS